MAIMKMYRIVFVIELSNYPKIFYINFWCIFTSSFFNIIFYFFSNNFL